MNKLWPGRWSLPNIPHRGWTIVEVIDIREDGQTEDETASKILVDRMK